LAPFNEILEADGSSWRITGMSRLKPAETDLLWFVGVSR
jgi:hypothetical protein